MDRRKIQEPSRTGMAVIRRVALLCLLALICSGVQARSTALQGGFLKKYEEHDNGRLFLYFANRGRSKVTVSKILLNGKPLPENIEDSVLTVWHRAFPNPVSPRKVCEVTAALSTPAVRPMLFGVVLSNGKKIEKLIRPASNPLVMESISFNKDLSECYLYLKNSFNHEIELGKIQVETSDVTQHCTIPQKKLEPGDIVPIIIKRKNLFESQTHVTISVSTVDRTYCAATVKVTYISPVVLSERLQSSDINKRIKGLSGCPMHTENSRQAAAAKILQRYNTLPRTSCAYAYVCRNNIENGIFIYGQIADAFGTSPHNVSKGYKPGKTPEKHQTQYLCRLARNASAPKPWYSLILACRDPSSFPTRLPVPEEVRLQVYYALVNGAKGIQYRIRREKTDAAKEVVDVVTKLNSEMTTLEEHLAIAQPVGWASSSNPMVEAKLLLCRPDTALLLLINHDNTRKEVSTDDKEKPFICNPHKNIYVTLKAPEWFKFGKVRDAFSRKEIPAELKDNKVVLDIGTVKVTGAFLISTKEGK